MTNRTTEFGIRITADGRVAVDESQRVARSFDEIGRSAKSAADSASAAYDIFGMKRALPMTGQVREIEQVSKQAAWAMRQVPMQMTDIVTQLVSGQSPFMVLMQQGGQLKDMFGGIGPAARAMGAYIAGMVNPFTIAAAAAAALGYAVSRFGSSQKPIIDLKTALGDVSTATASFARTADAFSADALIREFNKADAQTRRNIVSLKEYQIELARTSFDELRRSAEKDLAPLADFTGFLGGEQQKVVERFFGTFKTNEQRDQWQQLQREISAGTVDLGGFTQTYGKLFAGGSKDARDFIAQFEKIGTEAERLKQAEELLRKMRGARTGEQIPIPGETPKIDNGIDDFAREQAKQYASLYQAGIKYADSVELQAAAAVKLTEGEKILAAAKEHLTEAQYREVEALLSGAIARDKETQALAESRKQEQARADSMWKTVEGYDAEIRKLREHNEEIGLSAEQLDALRLARLDDAIAVKERQLAIAEATSTSASEVEALRIQIEQMRELRNLTAKGQVTERANRESVDMWQSVERAAHDTWTAVGRGGKNAFEQIGETLKSAVLDMLYQMTVKKWIFDIAASTSGSGVASQAVGSSRIADGVTGWVAGQASSFSGWLKNLWPFAAGGIMTQAGPLPLKAYSGGGVASSPQLALFGEGTRPEAYVPLPDGRSIPVTMQGGRGGLTVIVNEAPGNGGRIEQGTGRNGGRELRLWVDKFKSDLKNEIAGDINAGSGVIPAAMSSRFGMSPVPR